HAAIYFSFDEQRSHTIIFGRDDLHTEVLKWLKQIFRNFSERAYGFIACNHRPARTGCSDSCHEEEHGTRIIHVDDIGGRLYMASHPFHPKNVIFKFLNGGPIHPHGLDGFMPITAELWISYH